MTSNVGSQQIQSFAGQPDGDGLRGDEAAGHRPAADAVPAGVPEPDRRGHRVPRARPTPSSRPIADLQLADLQRRIAANDLVLELTPAARALIVREGTDPAFGARPLKRTIQRLVENPFARALLSGSFKPGDRIAADADPVSGTLVFSSESSTVVDRRLRPARRPIDEPRAGRRGRRVAQEALDVRPAAARRAGAAGRRRRARQLAPTEPPGPAMRFEDVVRRLERAAGRAARPARGADPGVRRDRRAARRGRRGTRRTGTARPAAVLILVYPDEDGRGAGRADRARRPRRPSLGRGLVPGRPGGGRGCRPRRDGAPRGERGGGPRRRRARASACSARSPVRWIPVSQLRGDAGHRRRRAAADAGRAARRRWPRSSSRRWRRSCPTPSW